MKIIYYFSRQLGIAPVKEFLLKYDVRNNDSTKQAERKIKIMAFIDQAVRFIAENKGRPVPPIAKPLKGYKFHEIRVKDGSDLIRVLYFCYHQEKIVLLNAFEKPDLYEKGLKKKIDQGINKILELTQEYYNEFLNNQTYEEYK
jgi:phage-related protein